MSEESKLPPTPSEDERLTEEETLEVAFIENNVRRLNTIFDAQMRKAVDALADLTAHEETVPLTDDGARHKTRLTNRIKLLADYQLMIKKIIERFKVEDPIDIDFCNHVIDILTHHETGTMNERISQFINDFRQAWRERHHFEKTGIESLEVLLSNKRTAHIENNPKNKQFSITFNPPIVVRQTNAQMLASDDLIDTDYDALADELRSLRGEIGVLFERFWQNIRMGALAGANPAPNSQALRLAQTELRHAYTELQNNTSTPIELTLVLDAIVQLHMVTIEQIIIPEGTRDKN